MVFEVKDYEGWLSGLDLLYLEAVREFLCEDNNSILELDDIRYLRECKFRYSQNAMELMVEDMVDARVMELRDVSKEASFLTKLLYDLTFDVEIKKAGKSWDFSWLNALNYVQLGYCCQFLSLVVGRVHNLSALEVYDKFLDDSTKYMLQVLCVKYPRVIGYFQLLNLLRDEVENRFVDDCRLYYGDVKFAGVLESFKMRVYLECTPTSKKLDLVDFLSSDIKYLVQLDKVGR